MFVVTPLPFAFVGDAGTCLLGKAALDPDPRKVSDSGFHILGACIQGGNLVIVPGPG